MAVSDSDLPRLPAARDRLQRLQRQSRADPEAARATRSICSARTARADRLPWVGPGEGSVTVHVPDIGGLLPVYVADRYEGFEVKTFPELTEAELDRYLDANVAAVREVVADHGEPDAALANHLIMGPAILARAGLRFATKVHGSDISYTVRPHPERFVPYAREGTDASAGVLVGSRHTAEDLWATVDDPGLPARTRLGPARGRRGAVSPAVRAGGPGRPRAARRAPLAGRRRVLRPRRPRRRCGGPPLGAGSPQDPLRRQAARQRELSCCSTPGRGCRPQPGARLLLAGFGEYRPEAEPDRGRWAAPKLGRDQRPARALRSPRSFRRRCAGDAIDLPGGLRHGRGRGRRLRGAAGLGRPLGDARGLDLACRGRSARWRRCSPFRSRDGPGVAERYHQHLGSPSPGLAPPRRGRFGPTRGRAMELGTGREEGASSASAGRLDEDSKVPW